MQGFDYTGRYAYHLIIVTARRAPLLVGERATQIVADLLDGAKSQCFDVLAYCVMPDHLHILALGVSDSANAIRFVQRFKQAGGYRFKREQGRELWQWSFFDRVVRSEEDLLAIARYIFGNPVRAALAGSDDVWPYAGGTLSADVGASSSEVAENGAKAPSLPPAAPRARVMVGDDPWRTI